jgi:hypothetical protein
LRRINRRLRQKNGTRASACSAIAVNESPAVSLQHCRPYPNQDNLATMGERVPDGTTPPRSKGPDDSALAEDYAALEAVLNATPRGRWFLAEYARRNRRAETDTLLGAVAKLEAAVLEEQRQALLCCVFKELAEIGEALAGMRRETAQIDSEPAATLAATLGLVEERLNAMIEIWAADDLALPGEDIAETMEAPAEASVV